MIFAIYYVAAIALVAAEMRGFVRSRRLLTPRWRTPWWIAVLVLTYAAQVALCERLAAGGPWPIGVVRWQEDAAAIVAALLALALVQSYALLGLYRGRANAAWITIGAIALTVISFAPVLTNADLYAYVGNALLGPAAYMPPNAPFSGEFSAINAWWHVPVPAATYGPLWMAVARTVTEFAPTLLLKMSALRLLGAALLGALVALLRAYGVPARILAVVAVNPALYFEFVLNAHNDLLPAAIIVAAAVVAPAWPALAAPLIAAAALIKAPFVLLGLPVLTRVREGSARLASAIGAVALAVAASWFAGGRAYLSALTHYASASGLENAVHALVILAALAALASAVAGARRLRTAVWLLPMLAVYTAPWYALWSLPYALAARRMLTYLAVWLPFVSWLIEPSFARVWTVAIVVPLAVVLSLAPPRARQFVQPGPS